MLSYRQGQFFAREDWCSRSTHRYPVRMNSLSLDPRGSVSCGTRDARMGF